MGRIDAFVLFTFYTGIVCTIFAGAAFLADWLERRGDAGKWDGE